MSSPTRQHSARIDWIDGVRGLAIIMVMTVHVGQRITGLNAPVQGAISFGQMGVQCFFVASAITLCISTKARQSRNKEVQPWLYFAIRRFFRIAPLYYFGILLYLLNSILLTKNRANSYAIAPEYNLPNIAANIFFVHSLYPAANNSIVPGGWSIATEMAFYLLFPAVFYICELNSPTRRYQILSLIIGSSALFELTIGYISGHGVKNDRFEYYSLVNQLPVFAVGIATYYASNVRIPISVFWSSQVGIATLTCAMWTTNPPFAFFLIPLLVASGLSLTIISIQGSSFTVPKILIEVGRRSYSMYILHFFFAFVATYSAKQIPFMASHSYLRLLLCLAFTFSATFQTAAITMKWIENPGIALGRRLIIKLNCHHEQKMAVIQNTSTY